MKIPRRKKSARTDKKAHRIWKTRLPQRPVASWKLTLRLFAWDKINYDALLFLFFFPLFLVLLHKSHRVSSHVYVHVWLFAKVQTRKKGEKSNGLKSYLQKKLFPEQSRVDDRLRVTTKPKCAMSRQETAHLKEKKKRTSPPRHFSTTLASVPLFFFLEGVRMTGFPFPAQKLAPQWSCLFLCSSCLFKIAFPTKRYQGHFSLFFFSPSYLVVAHITTKKKSAK